MTLYENFNTTNQTQPRFEAHENFVADIKSPGCSLVTTLPYAEQCPYIKNIEFCDPEVQLFNYLEFYYCTLTPTGMPTEIFGVIILCIILSFQFLILGNIADQYFCPALTMISKLLGMNEALAGVTLLAFGNGAPDLFTALASLTPTTEIGLAYGELVGAASFVSGVVAGSIIVVKQFQVFAATCARDYLFLIFAILYIDTILYTHHVVTVMESIGLLLIYFFYIIVVCVDQYLFTRSSRELKKKQASLLTRVNSPVSPVEHDIQSRSSLNYERESAIIFLSKKSSIASPPSENQEEIDAIQQFKDSIKPISKEDWIEAGYCGKFCLIVQLPLVFLKLVIPVADYEVELNGWSKLLNSFQLTIFLPVFIFLVFEENFHILNHTSILIFITVMVPPACIVYWRTKTNEIPDFHFIYPIIATSLSIGFISFVANEIIVVLMVLGTVLKANSSFLGCTLLAWGNSVGDLVTNITLAKQGYHKMGFAACTGGPLFNILTSCGITFLYKALHNPGTNSLSSGALSNTNAIFLMLILCFTLLAFVLTEFQARRSIGILLITLYVWCFLFTIGATIDYFHAYGTDHSEESGF